MVSTASAAGCAPVGDVDAGVADQQLEQALPDHPKAARKRPCPASSTTPDPQDQYLRVRVTTRFHPLSGRVFEFVEHRQNWGEDRVYLRDEDGELFSLLQVD